MIQIDGLFFLGKIIMTIEFYDKAWLKSRSVQKILHLLNSYGEARCVGGCVRDSLLGNVVKDIDISTTLTPNEVKKILPEIGAKAASRRDDHGSVLVILDGIPFDVTTLRKDIKTTGRHAEVVFTKSWDDDAKRRDFTINALYCDKNGNIYDPLGLGIDDIKNKNLKFIGTASHRIQEDYLRSLRYFRFLTQLNWKEDIKTISIIKENLEPIISLSKERILEEFKKILMSDFPIKTLYLMKDIGFFELLFSQSASIDNLDKALQKDNELSLIGRLITVCPNSKDLLLKKADKKIANIILKEVNNKETYYQNIIYYYGKNIAKTISVIKDQLSLFEKIASLMSDNSFPVKSNDIDLSGPELGKALKLIENWRVQNYCVPDKNECMQWFNDNRNKV